MLVICPLYTFNLIHAREVICCCFVVDVVLSLIRFLI